MAPFHESAYWCAARAFRNVVLAELCRGAGGFSSVTMVFAGLDGTGEHEAPVLENRDIRALAEATRLRVTLRTSWSRWTPPIPGRILGAAKVDPTLPGGGNAKH